MISPEQFVHWLLGYTEAEPKQDLPDKVKEKLKDVWQGYVPGMNKSSWPFTYGIATNTMNEQVIPLGTDATHTLGQSTPSPYDIDVTSGKSKRAG